ncbi:MAG TPA: transglycosylase SLT domain-containing protein, partial [Anaerolineales bacterium]
MLRARPDPSQSTAAASHLQGSGCFSAYLLPPLAVLTVGALLAFFALNFTPQNLTALAAGAGTPAGGLPTDTAVSPQATNGNSAPASAGNQVNQIPPPPAAPQPQAVIQLSFPDLAVKAAPAGSGQISNVFTPQVQYWSGAISRWASAAGLDPNLAAVVMQIESCGDPSATSSAGAIGLFQVMPYHFAAGDSPYDPDTNAARGLEYLRRSLRAAGND